MDTYKLLVTREERKMKRGLDEHDYIKNAMTFLKKDIEEFIFPTRSSMLYF